MGMQRGNIYGEIKETKNSSVNLKKEAFLMHVSMCTHSWSDKHTHTLGHLSFCRLSLFSPFQSRACFRRALRTSMQAQAGN